VKSSQLICTEIESVSTLWSLGRWGFQISAERTKTDLPTYLPTYLPTDRPTDQPTNQPTGSRNRRF